ncbi:hypothetical protein [Flavobacterium sp. NKUCC04_CG]|uniref:hypothetical protein n=1 Tax=Flavobacterium sp. NKUCC04_CG TaxID=2842121 RepID=UPI001C5AE408|nr:hypothetical protein [Flavobacterium sp. NKUCC04_CG]MBW3520374.1 hypothetical protein [Flavobacterium sp. NKUCC04_CG]
MAVFGYLFGNEDRQISRWADRRIRFGACECGYADGQIGEFALELVNADTRMGRYVYTLWSVVGIKLLFFVIYSRMDEWTNGRMDEWTNGRIGTSKPYLYIKSDSSKSTLTK